MRASRGPQPDDGLRAVEAALFALMGLMLGFAFAGAVSRLDARRELIVREANAIGTAYLRVDLLPAAAQPELRQLFRRYLEARMRVYIRARGSAAGAASRVRGGRPATAELGGRSSPRGPRTRPATRRAWSRRPSTT